MYIQHIVYCFPYWPKHGTGDAASKDEPIARLTNYTHDPILANRAVVDESSIETEVEPRSTLTYNHGLRPR